MRQRLILACVFALALALPDIPASGQGGRRSAAEACARIIDYRLLVEKAATQRAAALPASEREAFIEFPHRGSGLRDDPVLCDWRDGRAVRGEEASELEALVSFAGTPEDCAALAQLPALGAALNPIVQRQIDDAERSFRER